MAIPDGRILWRAFVMRRSSAIHLFFDGILRTYFGALPRDLYFWPLGCVFNLRQMFSVTAPDGFMLALAQRFRSTYAKVKVSADWLFVAVSVGLSFYFFAELQGVREGTLISALGVGTAVGLVKPTVQTFLRERLLASTSSVRNE